MCETIKKGEGISISYKKMFRYSTLRNFHEELGISISKEEIINCLNQ